MLAIEYVIIAQIVLIDLTIMPSLCYTKNVRQIHFCRYQYNNLIDCKKYFV